MKAGDRVSRAGREGEITMRVPVPPTPDDDRDVAELVRVRWDGATFSVVEDRRTLVPVK